MRRRPLWLSELIYRLAAIDIEPGNGATSPMPNLSSLTTEQQARLHALIAAFDQENEDALHAEYVAFNDFWPTAGGGVKA